MRSILLTLVLVFAVSNVCGQGFGSTAEVVTVFSQNGQFYLKSWPFDNEFPTTRGETKVFSNSSSKPIYSFSRGFDSVDDESNNLILSNDGEVIFYLISWNADEESQGLKSISIYRHGELIQTYSASEITGCDLSKERCELEYSNYDEVVDKEKSNWGSGNYKKAFKKGVNEQERFLSNYSIFNFDDIVYLTDSKKNVHRFSLRDGKYIGSSAFSQVFGEIKDKGRLNKVLVRQYEAPMYLEFPKLRTGKETSVELAALMGMRPAKNYGVDADKYRIYGFEIGGYLNRGGRFELEKLELFNELPERTIRDFFARKTFDDKAIPLEFKKWWVKQYFLFRKSDINVAMREKQEQLKVQHADLQKSLVAETIDGHYIPKDLQDAFLALDKELTEINRKEMMELKSREDMINYHMGLGLWMRNNWGLWGGSRLKKYFLDRGVMHPDDMTSVILDHYFDWIHGDKESAKKWEKTASCRPASLINFALQKWDADSNVHIEDAYKWIYQATRGGEHAVPDAESAQTWMMREWDSLAAAKKGEPVWEPLCPGGEIGRYNLRPFRDRGGKPDELLSAFLASSSEFQSEPASFVAAWDELGRRLKKKAAGALTYISWAKLNDQMKSKNYPAVHHSDSYTKSASPAYRVLTLKQAQKLGL